MIGYAEQKGYAVYVYGPNGGYIWHRVGTLLGYTSTMVTIKHGSTTYHISMWGTWRNKSYEVEKPCRRNIENT